MEMYFLPLATGDHYLFAPHFEDENYWAFSLTKGRNENALNMINSSDEVKLHYADALDESSVENEYLSKLNDDKNYHMAWAAVDAVVSASFIASSILDSIVGVALGGYAGYRAYKHYSAVQGANKAMKETEFVENSVLTEIKHAIKSHPDAVEGYYAASDIAYDHGLEEVSECYNFFGTLLREQGS